MSERDLGLTATLPTRVRPDAISPDYVVLIKSCSSLQLTHQIRLATAVARSESKQLLLVVQSECVLAPDLQTFVEEHAPLIEVRRR